MLKAMTNKAAAVALCLICGIATPANANGNGISDTTPDALTQAQQQQYGRLPKLKAVESLIKGKDAEIGVAWMEGNAMHSVNNERLYPLMSVSKLHVAIALLRGMERRGAAVDTTLSITPEQMRKDTYSPLLKLHPDGRFSITLR